MDFHPRRVDLFFRAKQPGNNRKEIDGTAPNSNHIHFRGHRVLKEILLARLYYPFLKISPVARGAAIWSIRFCSVWRRARHQFDEFPIELCSIEILLDICERQPK